MKATARVVAEHTTSGTALRVLKGEAPLLPRRTGPSEVHFVGGAAAPLGGDDLTMEIEVGPGAELTIRTVAASIALPNRFGDASRLSVSVSVAEGGRLLWLPEPLIAAARCRHTTVSTVDLDRDAELVWREELVCGRHGEDPGDVRLTTVLRRDGRALYRSDVAVGPHARGWDGPAGFGGARVHATVFRTGETATTSSTPTSAVMALAAGGTVATVLGRDLIETRRITDALVTPPQRTGKAAVTPQGSTAIDSPLVRRA
ncbi:urease accessory protein UreD [Dactylosporangium siamense]|uniref:Urease accessory protein UreD n=1 Tax=Dactylosporangium siamense TaxID=685454 RepID=A0A919PXE8_9ACTN|nr:urease accessory protein UreD [Dactylosporangium siamense]GIG51884.1 urease accessory protein UreD [Dactylosporangium siamense]